MGLGLAIFVLHLHIPLSSDWRRWASSSSGAGNDGPSSRTKNASVLATTLHHRDLTIPTGDKQSIPITCSISGNIFFLGCGYFLPLSSASLDGTDRPCSNEPLTVTDCQIHHVVRRSRSSPNNVAISDNFHSKCTGSPSTSRYADTVTATVLSTGTRQIHFAKAPEPLQRSTYD